MQGIQKCRIYTLNANRHRLIKSISQNDTKKKKKKKYLQIDTVLLNQFHKLGKCKENRGKYIICK